MQLSPHMLFHRSSPNDDQSIDEYERRSRLADLEAAQRRNPYAFGRGDGPARARRGRGRLIRARRG